MENLMSVPEVAQKLGIGKRLAWELVSSGEIPSLRAGHRVLCRPEGLAEWAKSRETGGPGPGTDAGDGPI